MSASHSASGRYDGGNALLDGLPEGDQARIFPHLTVFETEVPVCIVASGQPFAEVLFPIDALFSTTAKLRLGHAYEVAATGRNGLIGAELVLGLDTAPRSVLTQIEGRSARMAAAEFVQCVEESRALAGAVQRYLMRRLYVAEQFIACSFAHDTVERCARWILMLRDEVGREAFGLRAEFLGMMLGLPPRKAVEASRPLQETGAVRYADEQLAVLDAEDLAGSACECYAAQRAFALQSW